MVDPDRVLVPTLGRPNEGRALTYAVETFPEADVVLLAVVTPLDEVLSEGGLLERSEERSAQARDRATELIESLSAPSATDRVRIDIVEGRPGTVVPNYASTENIDHVVMYGHGAETKGYVRRLLGRSIAATVVERTSQPVTVVE